MVDCLVNGGLCSVYDNKASSASISTREAPLLAVAVPVAPKARLFDEVGHVTHRLHTAGDNDIVHTDCDFCTLLRCQYLWCCTSKAGKLSMLHKSSGVSICTVVLVSVFVLLY
jgi:hypothetical protein